jgi:hypothetical protein
LKIENYVIQVRLDFNSQTSKKERKRKKEDEGIGE